jgi:uncharacterized protein (TIGR03000 family)
VPTTPTLPPSNPIPVEGSGTPVTAPAGGSSSTIATVAVVVPQGGKVWAGNSKLTQQGTKWVYTSPALQPGQTYTLQIKASWMQGGEEKVYEMPLRVQAGDNDTVYLDRIR